MAFSESTLSENKTTTSTQVVLDLNSGESHTIADFGNSSWSPDGKKIMSFGSGNPDDKGKIITIFSSSGGVQGQYKLSDYLTQKSQMSYQHDWSADGSQVAFVVIQQQIEHMLFKNITPLRVKSN